MIKLGRKNSSVMEAPASPEKDRVWYPSLHIDDVDLGFKGADVGKELTAIVKLKMTNINERTNEKKDSRSYGFDVLAIDVGKARKKDGRENPIQSAIEDGLEDAEAGKKG